MTTPPSEDPPPFYDKPGPTFDDDGKSETSCEGKSTTTSGVLQPGLSSSSPSSSSPSSSGGAKPKLATSRSLLFGSPGKSRSKISKSSPLKVQVAEKIKEKYIGRKRRSSPLKSPLKNKRIKRQQWSDAEMKALVEHVVTPSQHWHQQLSGKWPQMPAENPFWQEAANFIATKCDMPARSASSVRTRVTKSLASKFPSDHGGIDAAEKAYDLSLQAEGVLHHQPSPPMPSIPESPALKIVRQSLVSPVPPVSTATQTPEKVVSSELEYLLNLKQEEEHLAFVKKYADILEIKTLEKVTDKLFLILAERKGIQTNPSDFATLATGGMVRLQEAGKPNLIHHFAKCVGGTRPGTSEPLMPLLRMPFGLVEYQIEFFSSTNSSQVKTPGDYRHWLQMMDSEFGERFFKLFRGPMWSGYSLDSVEMKDPLKARVNVACISYGAVTGDFKKSNFTTTPEIQEEALKQLKAANPDGRFWIKVDGTDVKTALQESHTREWNGDVDNLDGSLQAMRTTYIERRTKAAADSVNRDSMIESLTDDKIFLQQTLNKFLKEYRAKKKIKTSSVMKLKDLNWCIVETSNLIRINQEFQALYSKATSDLLVRHKGIEEEHLDYLRHLHAKKRTAATHVLVIMLSDELRNSKPYALPVQYIPYIGLKDMEVREICQKLKVKMKEYGLTCVGTVTDGEFSTLRAKGTDRPLHIVQIISNVRESVNRFGMKALHRMLTVHGENEDIPSDVVYRIANGVPLEQIRLELVRHSTDDRHVLLPWRPKTPECEEDMMRTIVGTYTYRAILANYQLEGVDFKTYMYVPEVDPITGEQHDEREDHNHLLKRIAHHARDGKFKKFRSAKLDEAMRSKETDLSQPALSGSRQQSVRDAEKLLSHAVAAFFRKKEYHAEAEYVQLIADWHEAADGRGLSPDQRQAANIALRNYILKDWCPWWSDECDLSDLDINRNLKTVCGFSRETLIGLTANIDSQERRRLLQDRPSEHPRAGTTDDIECFFSLCHRKSHGQHPTLKEWKYYWRKLIWEFTNRMDPDLPFWYWTLNDRFSLQEELFDKQVAPGTIPRLHQIQHRTREDSSIMAPGRAFLPRQHAPDVRNRVHKFEQATPDTGEQQQEEVQRMLEEAELTSSSSDSDSDSDSDQEEW